MTKIAFFRPMHHCYQFLLSFMSRYSTFPPELCFNASSPKAESQPHTILIILCRKHQKIIVLQQLWPRLISKKCCIVTLSCVQAHSFKHTHTHRHTHTHKKKRKQHASQQTSSILMKYMNNEDSEAETRSFSEGFSMEQASFRGSASQRLRAWAPPFASSWSTSSSASFPTSEA